MKLTEEEKILITKFRHEKSKEPSPDKPYREAFLEHDLFLYAGRLSSDMESFYIGKIIHEEKTIYEIDYLFYHLKNGFKKVFFVGDKFISFFRDGQEVWYKDGDDYEDELYGSEWAEKHLTRFKKLQ